MPTRDDVVAGLDLAVPGFRLVFSLLRSIYEKYSELKEGNALCKRLHQRLEDFTVELETISADTFQAEELLQRLRNLIEEYSETVTAFAEQRSFIKRVLKMGEFTNDIQIYNGRLDSIIDMITVSQTPKLAALLEWRKQFESEKTTLFSELADINYCLADIRELLGAMATKEDIQEFIMRLMRDMHLSCKQEQKQNQEQEQKQDQEPEQEQELEQEQQQKQDQDQKQEQILRKIIAVGQKEFPNGGHVKPPPVWLIYDDEVEVSEEAIDEEGLTNIYLGVWQGVEVAVKQFGTKGENPVFDKHFNVWRSLLHPHVAQLFGAGTKHGVPFFVYEYANKQSLDKCWNQPSYPKRLWGLLYQASLALLHLHKRHVVHGNMSCSKILITGEWHVKLFGFGASYFCKNDESDKTRSHISETFAAPECIGITDGKSHSPRFESDVYSFGLTIMAATIGKKNPFPGKEQNEITALKRRNAYEQPDGMSEEAWLLVTQMCKCEPSQRVSMQYVSEKLKRLAQSQKHE